MLPYERIVVEITEACPHRCVHCYNYWKDERAPLGSGRSLSRAQIRDVVKRVADEAPLKQVGISGGEPLLREDAPLIARDIVDLGPSVVVITSGASLTPALARKFPDGTIFEITLFSHDKRRHDAITGVEGSLDRVIAGAAAAAGAGKLLAASVVVDKMNADEVLGAMELGIAIGCTGFLLNRMNISRLSFGTARELAPNARELASALDAAEFVSQRYGAMVAVSVPVPPCVIDITKYKRLKFGWCPRGSGESYYTVSHEGKLRPCNHSSRILGDLKTQSFGEIVNSKAAADFWTPIPKECAACAHPLAELCRGGCPAASDECYGTRSRRDPYAELFGGDEPDGSLFKKIGGRQGNRASRISPGAPPTARFPR